MGYLERCLNSLQAQSYPNSELIVVDNGSVDGSLAAAQDLAPQAQFICNSTNLGFSRACNQGYRQSKGDIVIFLNADTEVDPNWIQPIVSAFQDCPNAALAGSRLLLPDGKRIQAEGGLLVANALAIHPRYGESPLESEPSVEQVLYAAGASLAARREFLDLTDGFDEGFSPAYFEDTDLAIRAWRVGLKCLVARESRVIHHESYATRKASPEFSYLYHRSRLRFVGLHFNLSSLLAVWPRAERFWYTKAGRNLERDALWRAYKRTLRVWPKILRDRCRTQRQLRKIAATLETSEGTR